MSRADLMTQSQRLLQVLLRRDRIPGMSRDIAPGSMGFYGPLAVFDLGDLTARVSAAWHGSLALMVERQEARLKRANASLLLSPADVPRDPQGLLARVAPPDRRQRNHHGVGRAGRAAKGEWRPDCRLGLICRPGPGRWRWLGLVAGCVLHEVAAGAYRHSGET